MSVVVVNGSGWQCGARFTADALTKLGFTTTIGNNGVEDSSTIVYPPSLTATADAIHRLVPKALLRPSATASAATFIIGQNAVTVPGLNLPVLQASCPTS